MAKKPVIRAERVDVAYGEKRWKLLKDLRFKAAEVMEVLARSHISCIVHGSVARGDVSEKSDIDIFISDPPSSFIIETTLKRANIPVDRRLVVQATPFYVLKGYIEIDKRRYVSFPLAKLRSVEREFFKFSGEASLTTLTRNIRVLGVDKRLMLIEPTSKGHVESSVVGREETVAHVLGISPITVLDRVHALLRRDEVGRTSVFIDRELLSDETFESVLKKLADRNPAVRRRLKLNRK